MTKSGAGAAGSPSLPHKSAAPASEARFADIFSNAVDRFVDHFERAPTESEAKMLAGAVLRHLADPAAHQVLQ